MKIRTATGLLAWLMRRYCYKMCPYEIEARAAESKTT